MSRIRSDAVRQKVELLTEIADLATCSIVELEVLYSARSAADLRAIKERRKALLSVAMEQADFDRAAEVMEMLADRGLHRSVGVADLLIAAVAERHGLILLHYDGDFETVAGITGQRAEWIVPRGSVP